MEDRRYKVHKLKNVQAQNFLMTPLELDEYIDFTPKRIYFISNPVNERYTGSHAHIADEFELFVMVQGETTIVLDDGHGTEEVRLIGNQSAIYIPAMVWHHFKDMSEDAIILAVTSTNYDPERRDYVEDYQKFQELLKEKGLA